jgi:probable HAF family extracellular repeat protein
MIDLWEAGCQMTVKDINDNGDIVGSGNGCHAVLCRNGELIDLGTLGGECSWAAAINNTGDVVGGSMLGGGEWGQRAFLWSDGVMTNLGLLEGGTWSDAYDISERGEVVGTAGSANLYSTPHGFKWLGAMQDLGTLGTDLDGFEWSEARAVNNAGSVFGISISPTDGTYHAVIWEK